MVNHILKTSLDRNIIITIIYLKNNEITESNAKVNKICGDIVKAYCYLRKQNRVFKIENILGASIISKGGSMI